jgi:hypothetical protein
MKYGIIKNLISKDIRNQMIDLMDFLKDHSMHMDDYDDIIGIKVPAYYGIFNSIQLNVLPKIEEVFNVELVPTYNYSRIYYNDSILKKHIDRPACEYSITINLYQEKGIWPIWMKDNNGYKELNLEPGDAGYYKGCEVLHWREKNTKGIGYQSFMHYVDKNGKYSDQSYDKKYQQWHKDLNNPMYQFDF